MLAGPAGPPEVDWQNIFNSLHSPAITYYLHTLLTTYTENYITYTYDSVTGFAIVTDLDDSEGDFTRVRILTIHNKLSMNF